MRFFQGSKMIFPTCHIYVMIFKKITLGEPIAISLPSRDVCVTRLVELGKVGQSCVLRASQKLAKQLVRPSLEFILMYN
jgi:hypothetical protein